MLSIKNRIKVLELRSAPKTKPVIFIVGDNEQTARAQWDAKNGRPIPANILVIHLSVIKPRNV